MPPTRSILRFSVACCVFGLASMLGASVLADEPKKPTGPERWAKDIADFERQDQTDAPPRGGILFVGSSSIRRWNLEHSFPDRAMINRGFGGSQISDSLHYLDQLVLKHAPSVVIMYAGDNDINAGKSPEQVARDFRQFADAVHTKLPKTRVLYLAIKPSLKRWKLVDSIRQTNSLIIAICANDEHSEFIDVFSPMLGEDGRPRPDLFVEDGLHLSDAGYELWTSILSQPLNRNAPELR